MDCLNKHLNGRQVKMTHKATKLVGKVDGDVIKIEFEYQLNLTKLQNKPLLIDVKPLEKRDIPIAYFYGVVCNTIAEALNEDVDSVRDYLCTMLLTETRMFAKERCEITRSLTSLTKTEFEDFVDKCLNLANRKWGIMVPRWTAEQEYWRL